MRGVDMFRNPWCASVRAELSNASAAWASDSLGQPFKTVSFGTGGSLVCIPVFVPKQAYAGLIQHVRGPNFLCDYPRIVAYGSDKSSQRGSDVQRICFPIEFAAP